MLECALIEGLHDVNTDSMEVVLDNNVARLKVRIMGTIRTTQSHYDYFCTGVQDFIVQHPAVIDVCSSRSYGLP